MYQGPAAPGGSFGSFRAALVVNEKVDVMQSGCEETDGLQRALG